MRNEPEISNDYVQRLNRVVDHVLAHLTEPLSFEAVAHEAGFSPFHFHRIFHSMLGETLHQFVRRLRLERALKRKSFEPDRTLTDIALECGFGSSSDFSRSFKKVYGVPPSQFDVDLWRTSKRDAWRQAVDGPGTNRFEHLPKEANPDGFVAEVRELPPRIVAYVRVIDSYRPDAVAGAYERLMAWADARGFGDGQWLGYMWDDPDIVPHEKCRYDAAGRATALPCDDRGRVRDPRDPRRRESCDRLDVPHLVAAQWIRAERPTLFRSVERAAVRSRGRALRNRDASAGRAGDAIRQIEAGIGS